MSEVGDFVDCYDYMGDIPMQEDRIQARCRVCGHKIKRHKVLGAYCPNCKRRKEQCRLIVAIVRYERVAV